MVSNERAEAVVERPSRLAPPAQFSEILLVALHDVEEWPGR
jgi:hypothetical protein